MLPGYHFLGTDVDASKARERPFESQGSVPSDRIVTTRRPSGANRSLDVDPSNTSCSRPNSKSQSRAASAKSRRRPETIKRGSETNTLPVQPTLTDDSTSQGSSPRQSSTTANSRSRRNSQARIRPGSGNHQSASLGKSKITSPSKRDRTGRSQTGQKTLPTPSSPVKQGSNFPSPRSGRQEIYQASPYASPVLRSRTLRRRSPLEIPPLKDTPRTQTSVNRVEEPILSPKSRRRRPVE